VFVLLKSSLVQQIMGATPLVQMVERKTVSKPTEGAVGVGLVQRRGPFLRLADVSIPCKRDLKSLQSGDILSPEFSLVSIQ
jgi:hypothetical protein